MIPARGDKYDIPGLLNHLERMLTRSRQTGVKVLLVLPGPLFDLFSGSCKAELPRHRVTVLVQEEVCVLPRVTMGGASEGDEELADRGLVLEVNDLIPRLDTTSEQDTVCRDISSVPADKKATSALPWVPRKAIPFAPLCWPTNCSS